MVATDLEVLLPQTKPTNCLTAQKNTWHAHNNTQLHQSRLNNVAPLKKAAEGTAGGVMGCRYAMSTALAELSI